MYLKKLLLTACILTAAKAYSQNVAINADGSAPDNTAILDVQSTSKGILAPRMTQAQREAIATPANGLLVYQTDGTAGFYFYSAPDAAWKALSTNSSTGGTQKAGTIIAFASGTTITLNALPVGLPSPVVTLGFGSNATLVTQPGGTLDLTGASGISINNAFVVPRDATITDLSATFSVTDPLSLVGSTVTIEAQVYYCPPNGGNIFTPLPGPMVFLAPGYTGLIPTGALCSGTVTGLNIPVAAGSRLLLVFSSQVTGISALNLTTGYGSAGLRLE